MDKEGIEKLNEEAKLTKVLMNDLALVFTCHSASYTAAAAAMTTLMIEGAVHIAGMDEEDFRAHLAVMLKHFKLHYDEHKKEKAENGEAQQQQ